LGFTDIDELGQEGLEKQFDNWLAGSPGRKRVLQDALSTKVADVESLVETVEGRDVMLSIELRIQYLAYRELKAAMQYENAKTGSIVVMDVNTGEVLALVNQPGFNPNDRSQYIEAIYRNRAATAIFEPGSTMKPFVVAAALESGRYNVNSRIDISSGMIKVGSKLIEDELPLGVASLETILAKSSNVGMSTIALTLEPQQIWSTLRKFGYGQSTGSGMIGESQGMFTNYSAWRPPAIASLSYGYGISVTAMQLAHAYASLASFGVARPVSLLRVDGPVTGERVISEKTARTMVSLLETVVSKEGTARAAAIEISGLVASDAPGGKIGRTLEVGSETVSPLMRRVVPGGQCVLSPVPLFASRFAMNASDSSVYTLWRRQISTRSWRETWRAGGDGSQGGR
jgi:cell division protein FtsI (penicillin-binding protein 3)